MIIKPVENIRDLTDKVIETDIETVHAKILEYIACSIQECASSGEYKTQPIFINHKIKKCISNYIRTFGYSVIEQNVGNTFVISWES